METTMKELKVLEDVAGARRRIRLAVLFAATALLAGCGLGPNSGVTVPTTIHGESFHGSLHGGQQPVVGSNIALYMAGTSGYGVAPVYSTGTGNLLTTTVTSGSGGSFDVTGDYTCPSASTQVYLVATGGNSGSTTNANLALMAALGSCGNLSASTFVNIDEVTTVASVYALAPFMSGTVQTYKTIGTSASNIAGLANAFTDVNLLSNIAAGVSPGTSPAGMTVPSSEINTLANIIASCINSAGGTASTTICGQLFTAATPAGGTAPTDTITAVMDIAQNPGHNVSILYNFSSATGPFQPTLTTQPNDFTVSVAMSAGNLSAPNALAADAAGKVFVTNSTANTVTEFSHGGAVLSDSGYTASLNTPSALAVDANDVVWVLNQGNNTVSRLNGASGAALAGTPTSGGGLNAPRSISFDSLGNAWIANSGNSSVTVINSAATTLTNYTPAAVTLPVAIGVNPH